MLKPVVQLVVRHTWTPCAGRTPKPALAVVSVDNVEVSALVVASLAMSYAEDGKRVLAADLSGTGAGAAALDLTGNTRVARQRRRRLRHRPPARGTPAGRGRHQGGEPGPDEELNAAWARPTWCSRWQACPLRSAPSICAWTSRAVAIVSRGPVLGAISSTGELVRLAGVRLVSAVVVMRTGPTRASASRQRQRRDRQESASGVEMITR